MNTKEIKKPIVIGYMISDADIRKGAILDIPLFEKEKLSGNHRIEEKENLRWVGFKCPHCGGDVYEAGFNGRPHCWNCNRYVKPIKRGGE